MYSFRAVLCLLLVCNALGYVCFKNKKDESTGQSVPEGIECDGPCFQCESVTYTDLNNKQNTKTFIAQGCGAGVIRVSDTMPPGPLAEMAGDATRSDPCTALGLGDVQELTCIDDIDALFRASPPKLQPLIPVARPYVKSGRVCCCRGDLCNDLTFPEPQTPANQCFSSTSEAGSVPCDGPCYTLQVAKNENGQLQDFFAQGCSTETLQLSSFVPARALKYLTADSTSMSMGDHSITNICPLLGLDPKDETVCVSSPKKVLKTLVPREILRVTP